MLENFNIICMALTKWRRETSHDEQNDPNLIITDCRYRR